MKKPLLVLVLLGLFFQISYSQGTLYDGWTSLSTTYLGANVYEYNYKWGASTILTQGEIDELFPQEYIGTATYRRTSTGIGTLDAFFHFGWENPVDVLFMSTSGYEFSTYVAGMTNRSSINQSDLFGWLNERYIWTQNRDFTFRTKGYTGKQNTSVPVDYYASYQLVSGQDRPFFSTTAGTSLRVERSFDPIPEPSTLLLLGSGLLGWVGFAQLRTRRKR